MSTPTFDVDPADGARHTITELERIARLASVIRTVTSSTTNYANVVRATSSTFAKFRGEYRKARRRERYNAKIRARSRRK